MLLLEGISGNEVIQIIYIKESEGDEFVLISLPPYCFSIVDFK